MLDLSNILDEANQNKTAAADALSQVNTFKMNTSYYTLLMNVEYDSEKQGLYTKWKFFVNNQDFDKTYFFTMKYGTKFIDQTLNAVGYSYPDISNLIGSFFVGKEIADGDYSRLVLERKASKEEVEKYLAEHAEEEWQKVEEDFF